MMGKHLSYLKYVLRHKFYVYQEGRKLGLSRLRLFIHDWHKFLPSEWFPYVENFYGESSAGDTDEVKRRFDAAWLKHQNRATHHWQYWLLIKDSGELEALEMPTLCWLEMLADWRGAGRAIHGHDETASWYRQRREKIVLHPNTRSWVEVELGFLEREVKDSG